MSLEDVLDNEILKKLVDPALSTKIDYDTNNYSKYCLMLRTTILDPKQTKILVNISLGEYDCTFYLHIYEIPDKKYTVVSPYIGSCEGCVGNLIDETSIRQIALDLVSKATIYDTYQDAVTAAQDILIKNSSSLRKSDIHNIKLQGIFKEDDNRLIAGYEC